MEGTKMAGSRVKSGMRIAIVLALAAGGLAACSEAATDNETVTERKANFKAIGGAFKIVTDEIKTGNPDLEKVRPAAHELATRTALIKDYFPAGSGPESGAKTKAKAAIWTNQAEFAKHRDAAVAAAAELDSVAGKGDLAELTRASEALGKTCKDCHTPFREK